MVSRGRSRRGCRRIATPLCCRSGWLPAQHLLAQQILGLVRRAVVGGVVEVLGVDARLARVLAVLGEDVADVVLVVGRGHGRMGRQRHVVLVEDAAVLGVGVGVVGVPVVWWACRRTTGSR